MLEHGRKCGHDVLRRGGRRGSSSYAYEALEHASQDGSRDADLAVDVGVIAGCVVVALALGAATLRRRTA